MLKQFTWIISRTRTVDLIVLILSNPYILMIRFVLPVFCSYSLVVDQEMLGKQQAVRDKLKNMKLDPSLLEWAPHLSASAIELEESRVEIEVRLLFNNNCQDSKSISQGKQLHRKYRELTNSEGQEIL